MEWLKQIKPGLAREETIIVEEQHLAKHIGSGSVKVLATPWMIGFMERTCHRLLALHLPKGYSSVGVWVEVTHLAPTPLGGKLTVQAKVDSVEDKKIMFVVQAWDEHENVGVGKHQRIVIDEARFLQRVSAKSKRNQT